MGQINVGMIRSKWLVAAMFGAVAVWAARAQSAPAADRIPIPPDRMIDWTLAGIPGGIPNRTTIFATIDGAAYGNGTVDATAAIQQALDDCPAGQVVYLSAGTYRTSDTIHLWTDTTLRGAGQGRTVIRYEGGGGRSVLDMRGNIYNDVWGLNRTFAITGGATKDSDRISLASTTGIAVGDILLIDQLNDGVLVDNVGSEGACTYCSREDGNRARGQLAEVTAVEGDTVHLNLPLFFSLDPTLSPEAVLVSAGSMVRRAGVESLSLSQAEPVNDFIIEMDGAQYSWLRDVEVSGMKRRGIWHIESLQNEIRDSTFHDGIAGFGRDRGYGVQLDLQSTANLVENNVVYRVDGGGIMTSGGAIGNVVGYNYLPDIRFDDPWWMIGAPVPNHSAHPSMNLWEGNIGPQIAADFIHGSSSHQTFFRCRSEGWKEEIATSNNNAIEFQHKNTYMTVMGCVLGTPGKSDTYEVAFPQPAPSDLMPIWKLGYGGPGGIGNGDVKGTLLRHGNWDSVTNGTVWDPGIPARTFPASLYRGEPPLWWGGLPWPPIGPDLTPMVGPIPAQLRYEAGPPPYAPTPTAVAFTATPTAATATATTDTRTPTLTGPSPTPSATSPATEATIFLPIAYRP